MYMFVAAWTCSWLWLDFDILRSSSVICMKSVRRSFVPFAVGIMRSVLRLCIDSNNDVRNATVEGCFDLVFETTFYAPD
eukprot:4434831-Ditylum_brightwellii.AAC.1